MVRKHPFPPEPETKPDTRQSRPAGTRPSGPAPKGSRRERAEAPTLPPPAAAKRAAGKSGARRSPTSDSPNARDISDPPPAEQRTSGMRSRRGSQHHSQGTAAATVDEVVADLSKDPRRETDD